jgi:HK97 gp10 family phage protein
VKVIVTPSEDVDFSQLADSARAAVEEAVRVGSMMIANDAKRSVAQGPKTGRIYEFFYRTNKTTGAIFPWEKRGVPHQASAPGEAPATDTGRLISSIVADTVRSDKFGVVGFVAARVEYAKWLEHGTRKIMARPFMLPAFERNRQRIGEMIRLGLATATQRFARK